MTDRLAYHMQHMGLRLYRGILDRQAGLHSGKPFQFKLQFYKNQGQNKPYFKTPSLHEKFGAKEVNLKLPCLLPDLYLVFASQ